MIYVHIPFCRSFCTYCDFYSEVAAVCRRSEDIRKQEELFNRFSRSLAAETVLRAGEITDDVNTLYIGGGTPSVLPLSAFRQFMEALHMAGHGGPFDEFTVEVNPEDIVEKGTAYIEGLCEMGVNRISMGVQSFDDDILRFMNRRHDAATAIKAYSILEDAGIRNISIDLIFGLPQLSPSRWQTTVEKALSISSHGNLPPHISSYQLSVEPGSMLARMVARGSWQEASDSMCEEQYGILCSMLGQAGYRHYEISNFAQPGFEARHNSAYWRHMPYVGLGPGAHSFSSGNIPDGRSSDGPGPKDAARSWNRSDLKAYMDAAGKGDFTSVREGEDLDSEQLSLERIMLALRTDSGISEDFLRAHCDSQALDRAIRLGNLTTSEGNSSDTMQEHLRIPESRFFISDSIIAGLL